MFKPDLPASIAFNMNALCDTPDQKKLRAALLHDCDTLFQKRLKQVPDLLVKTRYQTDHGIGIIGPHVFREAELLLKRQKPIAFLSRGHRDSVEVPDIDILLKAINGGLLAALRIDNRRMTAEIYTDYIFFQPELHAQAIELLDINQPKPEEMLGAPCPLDLKDSLRMGKLLGYSQADLIAYELNRALHTRPA